MPSRTSPRIPRPFVAIVVGIALVAAACGDDSTRGQAAADGESSDSAAFHPDGWPGVVDSPSEDLYDPVQAGEDLPDGFRQLLNRDDIFPVYLPTFRTADETDWPDQELVIGVELDGEARAYPVGFLNRREIVVDIHRGTPTFVTW
jgi:hypothetical protein